MPDTGQRASSGLPPQADAVIEGGGAHVLALAGAIDEFGRHGVERWMSIGGVGAGSIIAAYLATGHDSADVIDLMRLTRWDGFLDFGPGGRTIGGYWNFVRRGAVARGLAFVKSMSATFYGASFMQTQTYLGSGRSRLVLFAYDYSHGRLILIPDDLRLYQFPWARKAIDPLDVEIAYGVRMAMAIPGLYPPVELIEVASGDRSWIVDAGPYSNFPLATFDLEQTEVQRPTFGFRVVVDDAPVDQSRRSSSGGLGWHSVFGDDVFQTTPRDWDESERSELDRRRACLVHVSGVATEDFSISQSRQDSLVQAGRRAAQDFLEGFSIEAYRNAFQKQISRLTPTITRDELSGGSSPPPSLPSAR